MISSPKRMSASLSDAASKCFVNAPFERLKDDLLDIFIDNRLQPEIGLEGDVLFEYSTKDFETVAQRLASHGLSCTIHAPFLDLSPGATDESILSATRKKLRKAFELIPIFTPKSIVCHLDFDLHRHKMRYDKWLSNSLNTWEELLHYAEPYRTPIMLENTFEKTPDAHRQILEALDSSHAGFCLDVGHVQAFAKNTWQDWLPAMNPWLGQLHLHDNHGTWDDHLAIGKGSFDFQGLFNHLQTNRIKPLITLEPHHEEDLWESLKALDQLLLIDNQA